ncbi:MAG: DUF4157 domain-containing protein [Alphaproteobacteria bacterium]|nr:DUF4157 domain-containing protein [Alphaproteobacteria bacterium]
MAKAQAARGRNSRSSTPQQGHDQNATQDAVGNGFVQGNMGGPDASAALAYAQQSSGSPLDSATAQQVSSALGGADVSHVNLHTDPAANDAATAAQALGFAHGSDVYLADKANQPGSAALTDLLVHETSHTIPGAAAPGGSSGSPEVSDPSSSAEQAAQDVTNLAPDQENVVGPPAEFGQTQQGGEQGGGGEGDDGSDDVTQPTGGVAAGNMLMRTPDPAPEGGVYDEEQGVCRPDDGGDMSFQGAPQLGFSLGGKSFGIDLKDGVGVEVDLTGWKLPKEDWKKSKDYPINLVPGAGVRFEAAVGGGVAMGGKFKFKAEKKESGGETEWSVTTSSTAYVKSEFWGELAIGGFIGCKGMNVSASFYAKPILSLQADMGITSSLKYTESTGWTGSVAVPINIGGDLKTEVGVKANWEFLFWDGEIGRFKFGEWVIASAGMNVTPTATFPGGKDATTATAPYFQWGTPPKPQKVGSGSSSSSNSSSYGRGNNKFYCFATGTPVLTPQGLRPIESLRAGELVMAMDAATGRDVPAVVTALERHEGSFDMVHAAIGPHRVASTPDHRVMTGIGWAWAGDLTADEAGVTDAPRGFRMPDTVVWNLKVEGHGSYRVGDAQVRDH